MSDETTHPDQHDDDDFEAHGLKEGVAIALGAGALAVSGTAQAYVPPVPGDDGRATTTAPAKPLTKKQSKKKSANKKAAKKHAAVPGGSTSPKKPILQPDA